MKIGILGGGIIGVTTGVVLQEAGYDPTIITDEPIEMSTSWAAGATCYPFGCEESPRAMDWWMQCVERLRSFRDIPEAGIYDAHWQKLSVHENCELPYWIDDYEGARRLEAHECPAPYKSGMFAPLLIMGVDEYFPWLFERFLSKGDNLQLRRVKSLEDVTADFDVVINCTGIAAHDFVPDEAVYPARGQSVIVKNPGVKKHTALFDRKFYLYPRGPQCLIGGSFDVNEWDRTPDEELTAEILEWASAFEPLLKDPEVLDVRVGLRPMRDTVRLEREDVNGTPVIHNYGHGGAGYTLSWGCAADVLQMVKSL